MTWSPDQRGRDRTADRRLGLALVADPGSSQGADRADRLLAHPNAAGDRSDGHPGGGGRARLRPTDYRATRTAVERPPSPSDSATCGGCRGTLRPRLRGGSSSGDCRSSAGRLSGPPSRLGSGTGRAPSGRVFIAGPGPLSRR
jgi:hypothetical protein